MPTGRLRSGFSFAMSQMVDLSGHLDVTAEAG
jgi:hypothetical protein